MQTSSPTETPIASVKSNTGEQPSVVLPRALLTTRFDVPEQEALVSGAVPKWLNGDLIRTCPVKFDGPNWQARHWFDALGMMYAFGVSDGRVTYRSKLLDSNVRKSVDAGRKVGGFDTVAGRSFLRRVFQPVGEMTDNTNVNAIPMGDDVVALTETSHQWTLDRKTLEAKSLVRYIDDRFSGAAMIAHPEYDPVRKEIVGLAIGYGRKPTISVYSHAPSSRTRKHIATWHTDRLPYQHSFFLTPNYAVIIAHPFEVAPTSLLFKDGFIEHFEWQKEKGSKFVIVDRRTGALREVETDAFFTFHTAHAEERNDGTLVIDLLAYDDPSIVQSLRLDAMKENQLSTLVPRLLRFTVGASAKRVAPEALFDARFEFPTRDLKRSFGTAVGVLFGARIFGGEGERSSEIQRIDFGSGTIKTYSEPFSTLGEPVFVAKPGSSSEGDGVLLAVGSSTKEKRSVMVVLDATTLEPLAKASVEENIGMGFHGNFFR